MKQNILKLFLLAIISITMSNCQKDDITQSTINLEPSKVQIKTINFEKIKTNQKLFKKISKLISKEKQNKVLLDNQRVIYNSDLGFSIETDHVKFLEDPSTGYHSYSFPIIWNTSDTNNVFNLFLSYNNDNDYDAFIVEYDFTQDEIENINVNDLSNRTTKYYPIDLDISIFNSDFS